MKNSYIDTSHELYALCDRLRDQSWLAVDTEFHRENTYYPKLCLLQIATQDEVACIDPLALDDISPILDLLYQEDKTKVFHASRQDLEIFHQLRHRPLKPVFDTQMAAPLLGYGDQISYAALVQELLGATLNKEHTRTDWRQRPLSAQQLEYAANDVIYLGRIYLKLRHTLEQQGKLSWLEEDFASLYASGEYETAPPDAWLRLKHAWQLEGEQLAALQGLAAWRETTAQKKDQPRTWILRDEALYDLARALPGTREALAALPTLPGKTASRHGETLLAIIDEARHREPLPVPMALYPTKRPDKAEKEQVNRLLQAANERSEAHALDPRAVTSRRELSRLLRGERDLRLLRGWRRRVAGEALLAILEDHATASSRPS